MFFFFPVRDEYRVKRFPVIVLLIVLANLAVYLAFNFRTDVYESVVKQYGFVPARPSLLTLLTSQFLHGGLLHLGFNMWYLWLFGDNLEDRWGRMRFLVFYLAGGIFASLLYSALIPAGATETPVIGASGAIAGVLGAYAVLFPRSAVSFRYFLWFLVWIRTGVVELYAVFWLAIWFVQQAVSTALVASNLASSSVAFAAHAAGFVYGMVVAFGTRLFREARYRQTVGEGKGLLFHLLGPQPKPALPADSDAEYRGLREEIASLFGEDRLAASDRYEELVSRWPGAVLPERLQFSIAESLQRQGRQDLAASAYRDFLLAYPVSKLADNALLALGKHFLETGDYERAKNALRQIVVFYPYSDAYEEAKYLLEQVLPSRLHGTW